MCAPSSLGSSTTLLAWLSTSSTSTLFIGSKLGIHRDFGRFGSFCIVLFIIIQVPLPPCQGGTIMLTTMVCAEVEVEFHVDDYLTDYLTD